MILVKWLTTVKFLNEPCKAKKKGQYLANKMFNVTAHLNEIMHSLKDKNIWRWDLWYNGNYSNISSKRHSASESAIENE